MNSSDLFSHPYEPEAVANRDSASEPVQLPAFSDRPQNDSTRDTSAAS
jgi:hypothetical protein